MAHIYVSNVSLCYPIFGGLKRVGEQPAELEDLHSGKLVTQKRGDISGSVQALKSVSLRLESGDRLGLVGRNGSGKSTLLKVLAGIYEPTSGTIESSGLIAPMFSVGLGVKKEATGRRNIILRGLMSGLSRREAEAKVDEIVRFSELGQFIDLPVRHYSAGMAMRLAFATATAFSPDILLLDEWIGAGDLEFQKKASERMDALVKNSGITVIASHRPGLIKRVCTKALWLDGGVPRMFGDAAEVTDAMESA